MVTQRTVTPSEGFVVDASVAAKWYLRREVFAEQARHLLRSFEEGSIQLFAPDLIWIEVASSVIAAARRFEPELTIPQVRAAIDAFQRIDLTTYPDAPLVAAAYELVLRYDCVIYDAIYLALSQQLGFPFITADHRLYIKIRQLPEVIWIAQYPLAAG